MGGRAGCRRLEGCQDYCHPKAVHWVCDNWQVITYIDVVSRISQWDSNRLWVCGHDEVLVEKCKEHDESLFVLFMDLKKAYDSVPRQAQW